MTNNMRKVKKYNLLRFETVEIFSAQVEKTLIDTNYSWNLFGHPFIDKDGFYCQAIVQYDDGDNKKNKPQVL